MKITTIHIIVGTVTRSAYTVAQQVQAQLSARHCVRINDDFAPGDIKRDEILLICTSNTGVGDLPANIYPFHRHLTNDFPAIAGVRYGIINLGDSHYPSFAEAGKKIDDALADLAAVRIGEPLVLDASRDTDRAAEVRAWLESWEELL